MANSVKSFRKTLQIACSWNVCLLGLLILAIPKTSWAAAPKSSTQNSTITPTGRCLDEFGQPVVGAEVKLYRNDWALRRQTYVATQKTDGNGEYEFPEVSVEPRKSERYSITVTYPGRVSWISHIPQLWRDNSSHIDFPMKKSATLSGLVVDADGKPVAGALVFTRKAIQPIPGVRCAVTNEDGRYEITDLEPEKLEAWREGVPAEGGGVIVSASAPRVYCQHPEFAFNWESYHSVPGKADFQLKPGGIIVGRAINKKTRGPVPGIGITCQSTDAGDSTTVVTDEEGKYRLTSLRGESYNIWTHAENLTAAAFDSVSVEPGKTTTAPDFEMTSGGFITGRLINEVTRERISLAEFEEPIRRDITVTVSLKGDLRPFSGPGQLPTHFNEDGSYRFRVPAGTHYVHFTPVAPWIQNQEQKQFMFEQKSRINNLGRRIPYTSIGKGIPVKVTEGEVKELDFLISKPET